VGTFYSYRLKARPAGARLKEQKVAETKEKEPWVEISIDLPNELLDAVSDFLVSTLGRGVFIEDVKTGLDQTHDREYVRAYLDAEDLKAGRLQEIEDYISCMEEMNSGYSGIPFSIRVIFEEDWGENWKQYFRPVRIGRHFVVRPSWEDFVPLLDHIVVAIDPGRAFGVGTHPSTSLVLEAMEDLWQEQGWTTGVETGQHGREIPPSLLPRVLDVGSGTGILGIAAAKLGAASVLCLDIDPDAVEAARNNVRRNHVHDSVTVTQTPLWKVEKGYDVILANLDRDTLLLLADPLSERLKQSGRTILSGILLRQRAEVEKVFLDHGLRVAQSISDSPDQEWVCLTLAK
jgi:ribosomal protein L11 methyltransferase